MVSPYPVQFDVDFPSRPLNRLTTAFRFVVAIPIIVVLTMLSGETFNDSDRSMTSTFVPAPWRRAAAPSPAGPAPTTTTL